MKILLDTHMIIWALTNDAQLSCKAREMILDPENVVCCSTVSLWEIAIKNQKNPEKCPYHEKRILEYCMAAGYELIQIIPSHVLAIRSLRIRDGRTLINTDPFDRLLIAQAKAEECVLLSHDRNFENYQEKCICPV
jgi:PIN domain nuclease of toxin-antitoxin system